MLTRRDVLAGLATLPVAGTRAAVADAGASDAKREKELFLEGAVELANGRYIRARLLLSTLISVYERIPFVPQARVLVFYTHAAENPRMFDGSRLLREIDEYLCAFERMSAG